MMPDRDAAAFGAESMIDRLIDHIRRGCPDCHRDGGYECQPHRDLFGDARESRNALASSMPATGYHETTGAPALRPPGAGSPEPVDVTEGIARVLLARLAMIDGLGVELSRELTQGNPFEPFDRTYVVKTITRVLDAARDRTNLGAARLSGDPSEERT
jgi:hypothetical protein